MKGMTEMFVAGNTKIPNAEISMSFLENYGVKGVILYQASVHGQYVLCGGRFHLPETHNVKMLPKAVNGHFKVNKALCGPPSWK